MRMIYTSLVNHFDPKFLISWIMGESCLCTHSLGFPQGDRTNIMKHTPYWWVT
jgi:hypothetical protein